MSVCMDLFFLSVSGFFSLMMQYSSDFWGLYPKTPTRALPLTLLGDFRVAD